MPKIRKLHKPDHGFVVVPNAFIRRKDLSRSAKALLVELMSHEDGYVISQERLWGDATDRDTATRNDFAELRDANLCFTDQARRPDGSFAHGIEYVVSFEPFEIGDDGTARMLDSDEPAASPMDGSEETGPLETNARPSVGGTATWETNGHKKNNNNKKTNNQSNAREETPVDELLQKFSDELGLSASLPDLMKTGQLLVEVFDSDRKAIRQYLGERYLDLNNREKLPTTRWILTWLARDAREWRRSVWEKGQPEEAEVTPEETLLDLHPLEEYARAAKEDWEVLSEIDRAWLADEPDDVFKKNFVLSYAHYGKDLPLGPEVQYLWEKYGLDVEDELEKCAEKNPRSFYNAVRRVLARR